MLAFLVVVGFLVKSLAAAFRKADSMLVRALVAGLAATLVAYAVHSQFDVSYYDYKVLLLFWLLRWRRRRAVR